jgi:copper chaperone CopZ
MSSIVFEVPDISCEHCEHAITSALQPVRGVERVVVDVAGRTVTVGFDDGAVSVGRLKEILAEEEYPVAGQT